MEDNSYIWKIFLTYNFIKLDLVTSLETLYIRFYNIATGGSGICLFEI